MMLSGRALAMTSGQSIVTVAGRDNRSWSL